MKLDEFTIQVNESIIDDVVAHFQGRKMADRKNLYWLLRAMKRHIIHMDDEQKQARANQLLDRFAKYAVQKQFVNAKRVYDELYPLVRGEGAQGFKF